MIIVPKSALGRLRFIVYWKLFLEHNFWSLWSVELTLRARTKNLESILHTSSVKLHLKEIQFIKYGYLG